MKKSLEIGQVKRKTNHFFKKLYTSLAHQEEHLNTDQEVASSSLAGSSQLII